MFKSLYTRLAIYLITMLLVSAVASFLCTNIIYHQYLKANNDAKIMRTLKDSRTFHSEMPQEESKNFFKHIGEMNYQLMTVNTSGKKTFYGAHFRKDNISKHQIDKVLNGHDYHGIKSLPYNLFITGFFENTTKNTVGVTFNTKEGELAVFMRPDIGKTFSEFRIFLAILIALLLIFSIILTISATYSIIKPIQQLKQATHRLMQGDFTTPIKQTREDELGTLQYRFNDMRLSLKQVDDMRQHFVQNVSHEIKTPLTHIHHLLDQLQSSKDPVLRDSYINEIHSVTTQLSDLTKELLLLSEIDNGTHLKFTDTVALNQLLKKIVRHEQFAANQKDLIIMSDLNEINYDGNERLLYQAFQNLITNAIKYSERHGTIEITLNQTSTAIICTITDDGLGMDTETQAHLFERFYKVNHENDNSNGLGLAIAKAIIELHEGTIQVESQISQGTTFTIELPSSHS
ncbi:MULTISPECIES: HAMP domain-containing sensor histidine kinase [Staphylococcus]|uniref:Heme sensor protein HssS n=1 Tax=Staphylococcus hsinchuensis TaxID=3051183 RepID=A0ABZ3EDD0_9STAP|nr:MULTISPECIES: HAMP domain-containing sensor histidine kinase [unclassified Staphylococcus]